VARLRLRGRQLRQFLSKSRESLHIRTSEITCEAPIRLVRVRLRFPGPQHANLLHDFLSFITLIFLDEHFTFTSAVPRPQHQNKQPSYPPSSFLFYFTLTTLFRYNTTPPTLRSISRFKPSRLQQPPHPSSPHLSSPFSSFLRPRWRHGLAHNSRPLGRP
jgi:hypothetical protein